MEITIPVQDETGQYLLREFVGEGTFGGHAVTLASALPDRSTIVHIDGRQYVVSIHEICKAVCAAHLAAEEDRPAGPASRQEDDLLDRLARGEWLFLGSDAPGEAPPQVTHNLPDEESDDASACDPKPNGDAP